MTFPEIPLYTKAQLSRMVKERTIQKTGLKMSHESNCEHARHLHIPTGLAEVGHKI